MMTREPLFDLKPSLIPKTLCSICSSHTRPTLETFPYDQLRPPAAATEHSFGRPT